MKLAAFSYDGRSAIGVVREDRVVDFSAEPRLPATVEDLLAADNDRPEVTRCRTWPRS